MKYTVNLLLLVLLTVTKVSIAQKTVEEEHLKKTINQLFDGMRKSDSTLIKNSFANDAILQTIVKDKFGKVSTKNTDLSLFIKSVTAPHPNIYDERISYSKILIDDNLASVWTDYKFFIGDKFSHCGVNSFQLVKMNNEWKIVYLIDTRRKDSCN